MVSEYVGSPAPGSRGADFHDNGFAIRLETEGLVLLPGQPFALTPDEADLVSPRWSDGKAKNISLSPAGDVRGAVAEAGVERRLASLMARYRDWAESLILDRAPRYAASLERGRTSLRTRDVAEGAQSRRKDDRRLHIDAFASQPTGGRRILRVFTNVNPQGEERLWRVGEGFEAHARRWARRLPRPWPGQAWLLKLLGVTRATRTPYDAAMLGLHDAAKLDDAYQRDAPARDLILPAGASWIAYTDSAVHAAMRGRFMLEQTFYLPLEAMAAPDTSPARILERILGRRLT
ncbi:MAG TPA: Kdo hydroxylase family protein [Caulobacteraceae bacterium]|nr:Kdo hydroxylase family protein [Caulobacteraceae bacterium]